MSELLATEVLLEAVCAACCFSPPDPALAARWLSLRLQIWRPDGGALFTPSPLQTSNAQCESTLCSSLVTGQVGQHFYHSPCLLQAPLDKGLALNHHFLETLTSQQKKVSRAVSFLFDLSFVRLRLSKPNQGIECLNGRHSCHRESFTRGSSPSQPSRYCVIS